MSEPTKPNFMRYQRVAGIISSEPALKARLGTKTETVLKPNGDRVEFPKHAVDLTERIHAAGFDANTLNKPQILKYAVDVIIRGDDSELPPAPPREEPTATQAAPEETKPKKRVATPAKPKKVRKKKEAPVTIPAVTVPTPPEAAVAPPAPVEKPADKPIEKPAPKPKPAVTEGAVRQVTISSPPQQSLGTSVPFAVGCAVNSNLMAASQLLEIHDRTPEGKEIRGRLDKIIDEVLRRTTIPSNGQPRA